MIRILSEYPGRCGHWCGLLLSSVCCGRYPCSGQVLPASHQCSSRPCLHQSHRKLPKRLSFYAGYRPMKDQPGILRGSGIRKGSGHRYGPVPIHCHGRQYKGDHPVAPSDIYSTSYGQVMMPPNSYTFVYFSFTRISAAFFERTPLRQ